MERARKTGLLITPYTFRSTAVGAGHADVRAEMQHYLRTLKVDGVITDNPDLMPRRDGPSGRGAFGACELILCGSRL